MAKKQRAKYKTIPELFTSAQAAEMIGRAYEGDGRGKLTHLAVRLQARAGNLGYYKIGRIYYYSKQDIERFNAGLPPIPQEDR